MKAGIKELNQKLFRWPNNKDVVSIFEAMQNIITLHHNKNIVMLKIGCTLPSLANI